jgi:hypothetical protein
VAQEIEGNEALRFELEDTATVVLVDLTLFYSDDDGNGNSESVRVQAFNADGEQVGELVSTADDLDGTATVRLQALEGFNSVVVTSGVYDGDEFVFGGLADDNGELGQSPSASQGSDFMIEAIEFAFGTVVAAAPAPAIPEIAEVINLDNVPSIAEIEAMVVGIGLQDDEFSIL